MAKQKPTSATETTPENSPGNTMLPGDNRPPLLDAADDIAAAVARTTFVPVAPIAVPGVLHPSAALESQMPRLNDASIDLPPLLHPQSPALTAFPVRHIDVHLSPRDALSLRRLLASLQEANCRLDDPSKGNPHVRTSADAFRWLLQNVPSPPEVVTAGT